MSNYENLRAWVNNEEVTYYQRALGLQEAAQLLQERDALVENNESLHKTNGALLDEIENLQDQLTRIREALPSEGIAHASLGEAYRQCVNAVITIRKELEGVQEKAPEKFYCSEWNNVGYICEEQCDKCKKIDAPEIFPGTMDEPHVVYPNFTCGICKNYMTIVSPGKYQCLKCNK